MTTTGDYVSRVCDLLEKADEQPDSFSTDEKTRLSDYGKRVEMHGFTADERRDIDDMWEARVTE